MITVVLVDDHAIVRSGIKAILSKAEGVEVVDEAETGEAAIELVRRAPPDVVLMDVNMPGIGGMEATRRIVRMNPKVKVIILTVHNEDPYPTRLFKAGATGYLTKGCSVEEMVNAIRQVHAGGHFVSNAIAQSVALSMLPGHESPLERLSQREMQVFMMLMRGDRPQEISNTLHLSPKTVSTYRTRLFGKLGVKSDAELTRLAMRYGLLEEAK
ncbi:MAG: UvrY/SirA/GacA family response regulator transcription factor [Thiohalomonadaceae bacterium]